MTQQTAKVRESGMERVVALLFQIANAQGVALPSHTESLFDAGVLDSFGLLEFITAIEEEFTMKISDDDLVPANFETISEIHAYVDSRRGR